MLTIIFGAGASYDSDPSHPSVQDSSTDQSRPPLAKDLFDLRFGKQTDENPAAQALFPRLRRASNVELELENIAGSMPSYPPAYRQLLSMRDYLRGVIESAQDWWVDQRIHGVSTYHDLLEIIDRWQVRTKERVALIPFNYDTLLDIACDAVLNLKLSSVVAYVDNDSAYQLFKVHGSTNWSHLVTGIDGDVFDAADKLVWTRKFAVKNTESILVPPGSALVPAIAIPTVTKTEFEFPDYHKEQLVAAIRETDYLLIIGWRGAERHFLKLWQEVTPARKLKRIQVVMSKLEDA